MEEKKYGCRPEGCCCSLESFLDGKRIEYGCSKTVRVLGEVNGCGATSDRRIIRLNTMLVKQSHTDKVLGGVIEQLICVFDFFCNRLGGDWVNPFHAGLEKADSDNLVDCLVALKHVSGASTTSVCWWSDGMAEVEYGAST